MIHPMVSVFALIAILSICFALVYLTFRLHYRSENKRLEQDQNQYDKAFEVAAGKAYSVRYHRHANGPNHSVYLTMIGPKSYCIESASMSSPAIVKVETDPEIMDEVAIAWIRYRGLGGAVGGPVGNELGSPENPWT